jgi:N-methylhydantoinase B
MTNTLNTPIEALENSYPLVVETYALLAGSGGRGRYRGGRGIRRDYRFLTRARVSLLSERRRRPPPGLHGGKPGSRGENVLVRANRRRRLPGKVNLEVRPGDLLSVRTPGGGGFGTRSEKEDTTHPLSTEATRRGKDLTRFS